MSGYLERMKEKTRHLARRGRANVLALESSCDETAAAVVRGREVLSNVLTSQIDTHTRYGGVVPEIASRMHVDAMDPLIDQALEGAGITLADIDAVAVTCGPGLVGALLAAVSEGKALAYALDVPLVGVHHIQGHIAANLIAHPQLNPPFVCLVASGGHSHIVYLDENGQGRLIARTRDDAAGEALDKAARVLGLGYPGGPKLEIAARQGDPEAFHFPRAKVRGTDMDLSFSGLKTAMIQLTHNMNQRKQPLPVADLAASFQQAVMEMLVSHTMQAAQALGARQVALAGGVAANQLLRSLFERECAAQSRAFFVPPMALCTDNAAMIGCAGHQKLMAGQIEDLTLNASPSLALYPAV